MKRITLLATAFSAAFLSLGATASTKIFIDSSMWGDCAGKYEPITRKCGDGSATALASLKAATQSAKPGMVFDPGFDGPGIAVEVWALPPAAFGSFAARVPAPLGLGKVTLADGRIVSGFLCETHAIMRATEITPFGGWRAYHAAGTM